MTQLNSVAQTNAVQRYDMYMPIHKAIRAFMGDTLAVLGSMDVDDASEVAAALAQLRAAIVALEAASGAQRRTQS